MATFTGTSSNETITPELVSPTVRRTPVGAFPGDDDDILRGGGGNDVLDGGAGDDTLEGGAGNDTLRGREGNDILDGGDGNDDMYGREGNDTLKGGAGDDTLAGGDGDDRLIGGLGIDTVRYVSASIAVIVDLDLQGPQNTGGAGFDTLASIENVTGSSFSDGLSGASTANLLEGGDGDDLLDGRGGDDTLDGGAGNDTLEGGDGDDTLDGGDGVDAASYLLALAGVTVDLAVSGAQNTKGAGVDRLLNIENLIGSALADTLFGSDRADTLAGGKGDDLLAGRRGNDYLDGGAGADTMKGGADNDTYVVDNAADKVVEVADGGIDQILSAVSYVMADNVEQLTLVGVSDLDGTGSKDDNLIVGTAGNNKLSGRGGNDYLDGRGGNDTLNGGAGNDTLNGGEGANTLNGGDGNDTLVAGNSADSMAGDDGDDFLEGWGGNDTLNGGAGSDSLAGGDGADMLNGGAGNDSLAGGADNDTLNGGAGNDTLDGRDGVDRMVGGLGDDTYYIDDPRDVLVESDAVGGGIDTVIFTIQLDGGASGPHGYTLGDNLENLYLQGPYTRPWVITACGNALNNRLELYHISKQTGVLLGMDGDDLLIGSLNRERLDGGAGNDTLQAGSGDDTLDGGVGADVMEGGEGSDLYYVDSIDDVIVEASGGTGTDRVLTSVSWTLPDNVEALELTGSDPLEGTGSSGNNSLTGNDAANVLRGKGGDDYLDGRGGNDTLIGGHGNDTFYVEAGDVISDTGGIDTVRTEISGYTLMDDFEILRLEGRALDGNGNSGANELYGNDRDNVLKGLDGDDYLDGLGGNNALFGGRGDDTLVVSASDTLTGGAGADSFHFKSGIGTIVDFAPGIDTIEFSSNFRDLGGPGTLNTDAFYVGAAAHDDSDRIIYNNITGDLLYDRDGTGGAGATKIMVLSPFLPLSASDFRIV